MRPFAPSKLILIVGFLMAGQHRNYCGGYAGADKHNCNDEVSFTGDYRPKGGNPHQKNRLITVK
jgi:hypothetical protein